MPLTVLALTGCGGSRTEAAPRNHKPQIEVTAIQPGDLCITKGAMTQATIEEPTVRGYARGFGGDAAALTFTYKGETFETRELAGGQARRQIGLKLRAQDSCNVVYVMWRLDPKPQLDISVKQNPLMKTHEECGATGYTKIKPHKKTFVPAFEYGKTHTLRAEIVADELYAWIDDKLLWQGTLPETARAIKGPAGMRSDNVKFDLVSLSAPKGEGTAPACKREGGE
ncbi:MAG TPA: hypothetical protein VIV40_11440 [Kofleriaceae bacterium]